MSWEEKAMTLKTSCLKRGLVRYQLKRYWWLSAVYGLILFFIGPFMLLNERVRWEERIFEFPNLAGRFLLNHASSVVVLIGAAVLLAVCVCRYMQVVRSVTLFHAMPVTRCQLYGSATLSGFLLLAIPLAANALIFLCMSLWGGFSAIIPPRYVFDWFGGQLLTGTATLCFTICLGVLCGSSVAQLVFTAVLCLAPIGILNMASWLLDGWLFGFTPVAVDECNEFLLKILPMYPPQYLLDGDRIGWISVLQGIYIPLFFGLGLYAYQKRDVEHAGDVVAFSWIRPLFLYGTTFCAMLAGTCFIRAIIGRYSGNVNVLFMLLFALLGYAAAKMLLQKSFRIAKYYKGYVVFAVLVLLAYFAVDANMFGFGKSVPDAAQIKKAYVGEYYHRGWLANTNSNGNTNMAVFLDDESIERVRHLHSLAIEGGQEGSRNLENRPVVVAYLLQNNHECVREYRVDEAALYELLSTDAAKDSMYPVFRTRPEQIRYIDLNNGDDNTLYGAEKDELVACVRQDLATLSYEEIHGFKDSQLAAAAYHSSFPESAEVTKVEIYDKYADTAAEDITIRYYTMNVGVRNGKDGEESIYFEFNSNFTNTLNWMQSHGYTD